MIKNIEIVDAGASERESLEKVINGAVPVVIQNLDFGECRYSWRRTEYLQQKIGTREVSVHTSDCASLNFVPVKNFSYKQMQFSELLSECFSNEAPEKRGKKFYYLRHIGEEQRKDSALLARDFPEIASDFVLPSFVPIDRLFSTVLRVTSPHLQLWTHYDIMDNILVQVIGRKRIVLFPPTDVPYLYLVGDKSSVNDIDTPDLINYKLFSNVTRYEAVLEPTDAIFIPALWFHNVTALSSGIAVNVFWQHLERAFYDKKDLYGNKDLIAAQRADQGLSKAISNISSLPDPYRTFYLLRMIEKLKDALISKEIEEI